MDQDILVWLTDEQKENARAAEELFGSKGWETILTYLKLREQVEQQRALHAASWDVNRLATGAMAVFSELQNLPQAIEAELTALALQNRDSAVMEAESRYE